MTPDPGMMQSVGQKFQQFASQLPPGEQEAMAGWMQQRGGFDTTGHQAMWWSEPDAWNTAWQECWSGE